MFGFAGARLPEAFVKRLRELNAEDSIELVQKVLGLGRGRIASTQHPPDVATIIGALHWAEMQTIYVVTHAGYSAVPWNQFKLADHVAAFLCGAAYELKSTPQPE